MKVPRKSNWIMERSAERNAGLIAARVQKGLTQHELARLAGLPYPTVSRMEGCRPRTRNQETMDRWAKALARVLDVDSKNLVIPLSKKPKEIKVRVVPNDFLDGFTENPRIHQFSPPIPAAWTRWFHLAVDTLKPQDRRILCRRFGLYGARPARVADIAEALGLSPQAVFMRLRRILSILRIRISNMVRNEERES